MCMLAYMVPDPTAEQLRTRRDLDSAAVALRSAREAADEAYERAESAGLAAIAAGVPEAIVARELGVNRMTVRKWQGKR